MHDERTPRQGAENNPQSRPTTKRPGVRREWAASLGVEVLAMTSKTDADPYELKRFVDAQSAVYAKVTEELSAGRKRSHWMWFIFPQIAGLGFSATAQRFAIGTKGEAAAYLAHDILGPRLIECTRLVMSASDQPISAILGSPDDMKFRSSMTLFDAASTHEIFAEAIGTFYPDGKDPGTLDILLMLENERPLPST
jgi:uncharacterized protein (DUF1810 family)